MKIVIHLRPAGGGGLCQRFFWHWVHLMICLEHCQGGILWCIFSACNWTWCEYMSPHRPLHFFYAHELRHSNFAAFFQSWRFPWLSILRLWIAEGTREQSQTKSHVPTRHSYHAISNNHMLYPTTTHASPTVAITLGAASTSPSCDHTTWTTSLSLIQQFRKKIQLWSHVESRIDQWCWCGISASVIAGNE